MLQTDRETKKKRPATELCILALSRVNSMTMTDFIDGTFKTCERDDEQEQLTIATAGHKTLLR